jgi:hypothetical protein
MSANGRLVGYRELADRMGSFIMTLADTPPTPQPRRALRSAVPQADRLPITKLVPSAAAASTAYGSPGTWPDEDAGCL